LQGLVGDHAFFVGGVFGGTVGMTEDEFLAAKEAFDSGWASFGDDLDALGDAVDEVGCTKTEHLAGTC
jgi:hypothetical protein